MKILQINTSVNYGSTGRIAEDIGSAIIRNKHESYIAYGRINGGSSSNLIKIGSKNNIVFHGIISYLFDKQGLASKQATKAFVKELDKIKPDAIGIHNIHGYYLNYKILFNYIKANEIPVLWTFHDCWPFTGHCTYFDTVDCQKWQSHCYKCPLTQNYPKALTDRSYDNFEDKKEAFQNVRRLKIITPSQWLSNQVKKSFLKDYPVEIIHNGVDLEVFKPIKTSFKLNEKIVLGVANVWDTRKGLHDFMKLREMLPLSTKIVLIGLNKKQISALPDGIKGISRTNNVQELVEWYNKATVFVNPTYVDNFPTTNIEALACGTPVITYDTGGSAEAVCSESGFSVAKGDINALAKKIRELKKNKEFFLKSRKKAELKFNSKIFSNQYFSIFEELIK